jgi:glycosyltransferase involved in cell wall biosynthesis
MPLQLVTTALRSGIPTVLVVCDDWLWYGPNVDPWSKPFHDHPRRAALVERLTGLPARLPDRLDATVVFVSERTRRAAEDRTRWTFPDATVIPSGISLEDFPLAEPGTKEWRGRLLGVGRLDPRKGFATAVRALALLPDCTLRLVGQADPAHRRELEALGGPVTFDAVPRNELRDVYRSADALLFTSTWEEPFGLVPLEAMACGTPVVAVPSGGAADYLVDGENALLVPAGDSAALAATIRRLGDEGLRRRLVAGGLATAARYTTDVYADALEKVHVR